MTNCITKELFYKLYVEDYKVVHCPTRELAKEFLELAEGFGYKWENGNKLTQYDAWTKYESLACYNLEDVFIKFAYLEYYRDWDCEIVEFKSIKNKKNNKSGNLEITINACDIKNIKIINDGEILDFDFNSLCFSKKEGKLYIKVRNENGLMKDVNFSKEDKVDVVFDLEYNFYRDKMCMMEIGE